MRPKLRWIYLYFPLFLILSALLIGLWAWRTVDGLYRVDTEDALAAPVGLVRTYLIVGSDSRDGIDADTPNVGAIGTDVTGRRSDTIIVLRTDGATAQMIGIPRDLWVKNPATNEFGRVNATYNQGPANLIRAVTNNLGIPINHYVEVDFVSFSGMVDAMGGITIDFPYPVTDRNSGLRINTAGPNRLDGATALAYVRSRHYTETINGKQVEDPLSDLGRNARQQIFIKTVLSAVGQTRNPWTAAKLVSAASDGVRVDKQIGVGDIWTLAQDMAGVTPETVKLPVIGTRKGDAAVLELDTPKAEPILEGFRR